MCKSVSTNVFSGEAPTMMSDAGPRNEPDRHGQVSIRDGDHLRSGSDISDGTGQDGGTRPKQRISNIYKMMYRVSRDHADTGIDPAQQVVFYDAGLGTDVGATARTAPVRFVQKLLGSVAGDGIKRNIADCYEFVVNHYEEGDRIFLFGISRGAYTVHSLANLLMRYRKSVKNIAWEAVTTSRKCSVPH